jgi:hypothetical protein
MAAVARRVHQKYWIHRKLDGIANLKVERLGPAVRWISSGLLGLIVVFITLVRFMDPKEQDVNPWLAEQLGKVHANRFRIVVVLILLQVLCQVTLWIGGKWHNLKWKKLVKVLDTLVYQVFPEQDRTTHHYRATLFKARSCWFCGGWLGIAARSGLLYPKKTTVFSISPHTVRHCTGIAGECWRQSGTTIIRQLPGCRDGKPDGSAARKYMEEGYLDDSEFAILNVRSSVFLATGIRIAGELWGILVLDSTDPSTFPSEEAGRSATRVSDHKKSLDFAAVAIEQLVTK